MLHTLHFTGPAFARPVLALSTSQLSRHYPLYPIHHARTSQQAALQHGMPDLKTHQQFWLVSCTKFGHPTRKGANALTDGGSSVGPLLPRKEKDTSGPLLADGTIVVLPACRQVGRTSSQVGFGSIYRERHSRTGSFRARLNDDVSMALPAQGH